MKRNYFFLTLFFVFTVNFVFAQNSITVNVTSDGTTAFEGADVTLYDTGTWPNTVIETISSPTDGIVVFSNLVTKNYKVIVQKAGYIDVSQNFWNWDMPGDFIMDATMLLGYDVLVTVKDDSGNALENISMTFGSATASTDVNGVATFFLSDDDYSYDIYKSGYTQPENVSFTVNGAALDVSVTLTYIGYTRNIYVRNSSYQYIEGATVTFESVDYTTDASGNVELLGLDPGSYTFDVTANGYAPNNGSFTITKYNSSTYITLQPVYVLTLNITDGIDPIEAVDVTIDGTTITSDIDGNAVFVDMPKGIYEYSVYKYGWAPAPLIDTVEIINADLTKTLSLEPAYDITFLVTSDGTTAIEGAAVIIAGDTLLTDVSGNSIFTDYPNGTYDYTVHKSGYADSYGSVTVTSAGETVPTITLDPGYDVVFTVTSDAGGVEVQDANVTFDGFTILTNVDGLATFGRANDTYSGYTVTRDGYTDYNNTSNITISGADVNEGVTLAYVGYEAMFTITDVTSSTAVEGATISIGVDSYTTDVNGEYNVTGLDPGTYNYTISMANYEDQSGSFTIVQENVTQAVAIDPVYTITINVTDGTNTLEGIAVYNQTTYQTVNTDANGDAVFVLKDGTYNFSVNKPGYADYSAQVDVNGADINTEFALTYIGYNVKFVTSTGGWSALEVDVTFNGVTQTTVDDFWEQATTFSGIDPGTYQYSATAVGYEVLTGEVVVTDNNITLFLDFKPAWDVKFVVSDGSNALEGADVTLDMVTQSTDVNGQTVYEKMYLNTYDYTVKLAGYADKTGSVTVADQDVVEIVVLDAYSDITIIVNDGTNPIEGASVTIGSTTITTDIDGNAIFVDVINGVYNYTVTYVGYNDASGSVTVAGSDVEEIVNMSEPSYSITFNVTDGTNPIEGASVTIGSTTITTDIDGNAIFVDVIDGVYDYTVTCVGCNDASGSVTVAGSDVEEIVNISELSYSITFNVTDGTNAIVGADVTIGATTKTTDASGNAVFTGMVNSDYSYSVTATGYNDATGSVTVADADVTETVTMVLTTYSITFNVTDGTDAIENAAVTCDGATVNTDASGNAVFANKVAGDYSYTVTASGYSDSSGSVTIADADVTEAVSLSLTTGINNISNIKLEVYPNPTAGQLNVRLPSEVKGKVSINIISVYGKVVRSIELAGTANSLTTIELSDLPSGLYFINLKTNDFETVTKILKK